jgi:tetratricopeptide (TPR) repeat protein
VKLEDARDTRGVLRHIHNAPSLRSNQIVRECFQTESLDDGQLLEAVSRRLRRAIGALANGGPRERTEHEIIRRCDLEGAPHKEVQADLIISRRAFYYHRRRGTERLAALLRSDDAGLTHAIVDRIDEFDLQMNRAAGLAALGQIADASAAVARCHAIATTAEQRVRAAVLLAEFSIDLGGLDSMRATSVRLERELLALGSDSDGHTAASRLNAQAALTILRWRVDGTSPMTAMRATARATKEVRCADSVWLHARASFLISYADLANVAGAPAEAVRALREADGTLQATNEASPALRARCAISEAAISLALEHPLSHAAERARAALELSTRHGLLPLALDASAVLAMTEVARGRTEKALEVVRSAREAALGLEEHEAAIFYFLTAARVFASAGSLGEAAVMLERATDGRARFETLQTVERFTKAIVLLAQGRTGDALRCASETMRLAEQLGLRRMTGRALGVRARALSSLGRRREARASAGDAIELLERFGTSHELAIAYDLAGTLDRSARRKRQALELRAAIAR